MLSNKSIQNLCMLIISSIILSGCQTKEQKFISACTNGNYDTIITLLKNGVDKNTKTEKNGTTCLMAAAGKGHANIVEKLLALNADSTITDNVGNTALDYAIYYKYENIANIIIADQDVKRIALFSEPEKQQIFLELAQRQQNNADISDLLSQYQITQRQVEIIQQEGQAKNWPVVPPTPTPTPEPTPTPIPTATPDPEKVRKETIERQFSAWDGSHRNLVRVVKEAMHDPDSFDHIKTVYWDRGDKLVVKMDFRGKNTFGALVKNTVTAETDLEGNILSIQQE